MVSRHGLYYLSAISVLDGLNVSLYMLNAKVTKYKTNPRGLKRERLCEK